MKRIISLLIGATLALSFFCAAFAESSSDAAAMVMIPVDAEDMRLGQCLAPRGYRVNTMLDVCGPTRSVTSPIGLLVAATSQDNRVIMTYESASTFIEIVSSTVAGNPNRVHQDGGFDTETMTPMLRYLQPADYALNYLNGMFPGTEMTYAGSMDMSQYNAVLQQLAQIKYDALMAGHPELVGIRIDGVAYVPGTCGFTCEMNGETYMIIVKTLIEATQMTINYPLLQGNLVETEILWTPVCTYVLACPQSEPAAVFSAFEVFAENTVTSDQFNAAYARLADELRQIIVDARMETGRSYSYSVLSSSVSSEDTYNDDRFTDYIFDQNDYTLSDGTHVKISTAYDYVYEGDNGVVWFSDSAFPQPGIQLTPNR